MKTLLRPLSLVVGLACGTASADGDSFANWEEKTQYDCNAPFEHFSPPDVKEQAGWKFEHTGGTVKVRRATPRKGKPVLGLLAGVKDLEPDTKATLDQFLANFEAADVDAIVVGGDSSAEPEGLEQIVGYFAQATKRPVLIVAGNMERGAALNYAILKARAAGALHLLNLDVIHRYDGDGIDVVGMGGYHDKAFLHVPAGCLYKDKDLAAVERAAAASDDPVVLLTHGPPRQRGQQAIDFVPGVENVGDPDLTALIQRAKISFGISGHILEAAARATDLAGKPLPQKKLHPSLFVNQGSANPLPWKLNDGTTSYGLAALFTLDGTKASYEVLRAGKPKAP